METILRPGIISTLEMQALLRNLWPGSSHYVITGGVYGYIDEFEPFIEKLSQYYQVICIATRGHGKSEIGHVQYSYDQRADDAYKVIRSITRDSVIVLGFSDGGFLLH